MTELTFENETHIGVFRWTPFQNWTRNATALLGTVELDVDFAVPLDDVRAELKRLLRSDELWDQRVGVLQVTDAIQGFVRVRMLVSASNVSVLFHLRCNVCEGMVEWLQRTQVETTTDLTGRPPLSRLAASDFGYDQRIPIDA